MSSSNKLPDTAFLATYQRTVRRPKDHNLTPPWPARKWGRHPISRAVWPAPTHVWFLNSIIIHIHNRMICRLGTERGKNRNVHISKIPKLVETITRELAANPTSFDMTSLQRWQDSTPRSRSRWESLKESTPAYLAREREWESWESNPAIAASLKEWLQKEFQMSDERCGSLQRSCVK